MGLFRPKRLPYGVASSPALWQQTMDKVFHALPGVCCFVDDILVAGRDEKEHRQRLIQVLDRIQEHGIKVKRSKCCFNETTVEYLGFRLDARGVHKTDDKIRAVQEAAAPTDVKKLQSFLGLVTFYGKFVKDLATLAQPLYALLSKDVKWNWTNKCQQAFDAVKREVTSNSFLAHFNEHLPVKLVCDASSVGLGAVLAHVDDDGRERPIAYASRLLNEAERGYSQIDKEALALIYGVKKYHMYLYGRKHFTLVTDHKPLLAIFGSKSGLPKLVAARLHRWAITLAAYNYEVEYRSTRNMGNADALSRLPVDAAPDEEDMPQVLLIETHGTPLTAVKVAQATSKDPVLAKVREGVVAGKHTVEATVECQPYLDVWDELSVEKGCVLRGARVTIPYGLRDDVLEELHADHQGMVRTKAMARIFVWWPSVDKDIEKKIRKCGGCALQQSNPKITNTHPWVYPETPWQRIHVDFAGPFMGHMFMIVVDAHSKWPEVIRMKLTTARRTVNALRRIFATHGIPVRIVTDNGPQFVSKEFQDFCTANGIQHTLSAPYHPATNGEAERFVRTFKRNMKCRSKTSEDVETWVSRFLITYRTTPHSLTEMTPSQMLMGRRIRTRMDLVRPDFLMERRIQEDRQRGAEEKVRKFKKGEEVLVRMYGADKWAYGVVEEKQGELHYQVKTGGRSMKRHVDQLRATEAEESFSQEMVGGPYTQSILETPTEISREDAVAPMSPQAPPGSPMTKEMNTPCGSPAKGMEDHSGVRADTPTTPPIRVQPPRATRGIRPVRYRE